MQASFDGSKEVAFTIVAMTVSLVAIFIPVLFMGGLVGRLLEEFAVTIGVAIIVSGFVSISLTPMLCSRFLKPPHEQRHGALYNLTERMFERWLHAYDWSLRLSLKHRSLTMASSLLLVAGSAYLFMLVPKGFLPSEDQDRFNISVEGIQGIGFDEMLRHQMEVAAIVAKDPDIIGFSNNVGGGGGGGGGGQLNTGRMGIDLKPQVGAHAIGRSDHRRAASASSRRCPGVRVFMVNQPPINLGGQQGARSIYQFTLQDTDTRGALSGGAAARGQDPGDSGHRGRQQRSASQQPADSDRYRSRSDLVARPDGESGRDGALQRLRHAAGLADLRAEQSVLR